MNYAHEYFCLLRINQRKRGGTRRRAPIGAALMQLDVFLAEQPVQLFV